MENPLYLCRGEKYKNVCDPRWGVGGGGGGGAEAEHFQWKF